MLNLFPIQWLALLAYFLLRIITSLVLLSLGIKQLQHKERISQNISIPFFPFPRATLGILILTELSIAILLFLGLYTQIAALLLIVLSVKLSIFKKRFTDPLIPNRTTLLLLLGIGLSLFITGAGAFAFDLPI